MGSRGARGVAARSAQRRPAADRIAESDGGFRTRRGVDCGDAVQSAPERAARNDASVDKVSVGGPLLLARTSTLLVAGCVLTSAALGVPIDIATPMSVIVACMPFLVAYPLAISFVTHSLASKLAQQNRRLDELGRTDGLTRLDNRRQGFASAETELARYRRTGRPGVLAILDVDRFKEINDRYGHPTGDDVLCGVADTLRRCCRDGRRRRSLRRPDDIPAGIFGNGPARGRGGPAKRIRQQAGRPDVREGPGTCAAPSASELPRPTTRQRISAPGSNGPTQPFIAAKDAGRDRFMGAAPLATS